MAFLEIPIAAIAAFMLGFGWYTALFGKAWQAESGITDEQAESGLLLTHGTAFLMMCVMAFGISYIVHLHDVAEQTFVHGGFHGVLAAALYAVPAVAIHYSYQKKSLKLFLIDASYILIFSGLMGGILAALKLG